MTTLSAAAKPRAKAAGNTRLLDEDEVGTHTAQTNLLELTDGRGHERTGGRAVGAAQQQPPARHERDEPAKCERHGVEIGVDVRVIELDVVDDGDIRQIFQELRRLVEERAVVL